MENVKKMGLAASIRLVCRDKNGEVKWIQTASDEVNVK